MGLEDKGRWGWRIKIGKTKISEAVKMEWVCFRKRRVTKVVWSYYSGCGYEFSLKKIEQHKCVCN